MSVFALVLLVLAVLLLAAAELPRLGLRTPGVRIARQRPRKSRRKPHLTIVRDERDEESDEFARSVERDLANLPTFDPREKKNSKN
jgi:hypothetical protein